MALPIRWHCAVQNIFSILCYILSRLGIYVSRHSSSELIFVTPIALQPPSHTICLLSLVISFGKSLGRKEFYFGHKICIVLLPPSRSVVLGLMLVIHSLHPFNKQPTVCQICAGIGETEKVAALQGLYVLNYCDVPALPHRTQSGGGDTLKSSRQYLVLGRKRTREMRVFSGGGNGLAPSGAQAFLKK